MGIFSNELAPNLYNSYTEWYEAFSKYRNPNTSEEVMAHRYFDSLDNDFEIVCDRCGHHLGYVKSPEFNFGQNHPVSGISENKDVTYTFYCGHCRQTIADNAMFGGED